MIEFIKGVLTSKEPSYVVLDTGGVGYGLAVSLTTYDSLPAVGSECRLLVHEQIREDAYILYGFSTADERGLFRMLTGVSGVGPKISIGALSGMGLRELRSSIAQRDIKRLSSIPGLGKRTAERIVVELADKINPLEAFAETHGESDTGGAAARDAVLALVALGHSQDAAVDAVKRVVGAPDAPKTTSEIVKQALSSAER